MQRDRPNQRNRSERTVRNLKPERDFIFDKYDRYYFEKN